MWCFLGIPVRIECWLWWCVFHFRQYNSYFISSVLLSEEEHTPVARQVCSLDNAGWGWWWWWSVLSQSTHSKNRIYFISHNTTSCCIHYIYIYPYGLERNFLLSVFSKQQPLWFASRLQGKCDWEMMKGRLEGSINTLGLKNWIKYRPNDDNFTRHKTHQRPPYRSCTGYICRCVCEYDWMTRGGCFHREWAENQPPTHSLYTTLLSKQKKT